MSNPIQYLHFTLGPVQGFVSQARRTRDFWAGSFLLSWLTAHAMKAVQDADGVIVMPSTTGDKLLGRVKQSLGKGPTIGSLPNNFIASVDANFDGNVAVNAVQNAWKDLANAVWKNDKFEEVGVNKDLWDAQITGFWDMAWVMSDSDDAGVLAQRKNWRSYMPPESLGDKCTMMGEWQDLSGVDRPNPKVQAKFWKKINHDKGLDLRDNERLCAIAYVKRRFVHAWQGVAGHQGWALPTSVPSTSYMAAVHWLEKLMQANPDSQATFTYAKKAISGERLTRIRCITDVLKDNDADHLKALADVDGRSLFDTEIESDAALRDAKRTMLKSVSNFDALLSPFYAILMMDGDSLGKTKKALADAGKSPDALSKALAAFTTKVPGVVKANNGFLIYAGGDDVLALLPLEDALPCAASCRKVYQEVFREIAPDITATISAAIEYAHMKLPLTMILKDAHKLLDEVAKDATGRDAVACRIWKPGGLQQTWAMPWDEALDGQDVKISALANKLGADKTGDAGYASKFLYYIRETLTMLDGDDPMAATDIEAILVADYIGSGLLEGVKDKKGTARALVTPLLNQCRLFDNKADTGRYSADGALLLRFLAQKGVER